MTTSYSDSLRLPLQEFGDNINTWGSIVNNGLVTLDKAVAGITTLNLTGSVTVDFTTSVTDGSDSLSKRGMILMTGLPTADVSITTPAVTKFYHYYTSLQTSAYTVFIHPTGSNVGVTISANDRGTIFCDGTDMFIISRYIDPSIFLLAANNLSDLTNVSAALVNLGINASVLSLLEGLTASAAELNVLDGINTSITASTFNLLEGLAASAAEINVLDGVSTSLNASVLNLLVGLAVSAGVLNDLGTQTSLADAKIGGRAIVAANLTPNPVTSVSVREKTGNISTVSAVATSPFGMKVTFVSSYASAAAYTPLFTGYGPTTGTTEAGISFYVTEVCAGHFNFRWNGGSGPEAATEAVGIVVVPALT